MAVGGGSAPAVEIPVRVDTSAAKKAIADLGKEILGKLTPTVDIGDLATKAWDTASAAISAAAQYMREAVAAAADAERTQRGLSVAVGEAYDRLSAYNGLLAERLGMDDDDIAALQLKLQAYGVTTDKLEQATTAAIGYSEATGKDLSLAAKKAAAAVKEGGDELDKMIGLFRIADAQTQTFSGQMRRLDTSFGALSEAIGFLVVNSEAWAKALERVDGNIGALTTQVERQDSPLRDLSDGVAGVVSTFSSLLRVSQDVWRFFSSAPGSLWDSTFGNADVARVFGLTGAIDSFGAAVERMPSKISMMLGPFGVFIRAIGEFADAMNMAADAINDADKEIREAEAYGGWMAKFIEEGERKKPKPSDGYAATNEEADGPMGKGMGRARAGFRDGIKRRGTRTSPAAPKQKPDDFRGTMMGVAIPQGEFASWADEPTARGDMLNDMGNAYGSETAKLRKEREDAEKAGRESFSKYLEEYRENEKQKERDFYNELAGIGVGGVGGMISNTIMAWASGEESLKDAAGKAFYGMLAQIGQGLFSMGFAAVAAGTLGSVAPIFAPATGGPAGIAAGATLMAAGGAMMALGGLGMSQFDPKSSGNLGAAAGKAAGRIKTSVADASPRGFTDSASEREPRTTVINVNLGRGYVTGTPREVGRALRDILRQAESLEPGWAR